jgi:hypothetical protein
MIGIKGESDARNAVDFKRIEKLYFDETLVKSSYSNTCILHQTLFDGKVSLYRANAIFFEVQVMGRHTGMSQHGEIFGSFFRTFERNLIGFKNNVQTKTKNLKLLASSTGVFANVVNEMCELSITGDDFTDKLPVTQFHQPH